LYTLKELNVHLIAPVNLTFYFLIFLHRRYKWKQQNLSMYNDVDADCHSLEDAEEFVLTDLENGSSDDATRHDDKEQLSRNQQNAPNGNLGYDNAAYQGEEDTDEKSYSGEDVRKEVDTNGDGGTVPVTAEEPVRPYCSPDQQQYGDQFQQYAQVIRKVCNGTVCYTDIFICS
jgi:hypothetical protein